MTLLRLARVAVALALWLGAAGPSAAESAAKLLPNKSQIVFVSKQMGVPVEGAFGRFKADVSFDPKKPEGGSVALTIDMGSATLGSPQTDAELPKADWFDVIRFPQADFKSSAIRGLGGGRFEIEGKLTIKGHAQELVVPVTITQGDGHSVASGSFTIQRLAFKVGSGEWTDTSMLANDVQVRFRLTLSGLGAL